MITGSQKFTSCLQRVGITGQPLQRVPVHEGPALRTLQRVRRKRVGTALARLRGRRIDGETHCSAIIRLRAKSNVSEFGCDILALMWKLIFITTTLASSLFAQQTTSAQEDPAAMAAQNAQATINWDKASSPGMKAEMVLVKKGQMKGHLAVTYRVKVTGAPENQRYVLMSWPIMFPKPLAVMDGLAIDSNGVVFCPAH